MHIIHGLHITIQNVLLPSSGFDLNLILHVSFGRGLSVRTVIGQAGQTAV